MDKNTLSNYGWIVIAVLVLAVMIALATPFGGYIRAGVENTVQGLFETEDAALGKVLDDMGIVPSVDELQAKHKFDYYSTFSGAIADANADTIGVNADATKDNATAGIYTDKGKTFVVLLKDTTETSKLTLTADMIINLGGNVLNFDSNVGISNAVDSNNTINIDGRLNGSTICAKTRTVQCASGTVNIDGGTYIINSDSSDTSNIYFHTSTTGTVANCTVTAITQNGKVAGIYFKSTSTGTVTNCTVTATSNYVITDSEYTASSNGIYCEGKSIVTLNDCSVKGVHSGVSSSGTLYVNGGTYEGYGHGGFYFSGTGSTFYVKNAITKECDMPDGYTVSVESNGAGFYIGGSNGNNITVYMDNCDIYGSIRPIVLRGSSGEQNNTLYISNSNINTSAKIRIDNDTHKLYIGKGNNFTAENTTRPSSVIITDETYCQ